MQPLLFGLTLAAASVLAIGMGWPIAPWAGQRASLTVEPHRLGSDYGAPGSAGGFALGWLAADTVTDTAVVTPSGTDNSAIRHARRFGPKRTSGCSGHDNGASRPSHTRHATNHNSHHRTHPRSVHTRSSDAGAGRIAGIADSEPCRRARRLA